MESLYLKHFQFLVETIAYLQIGPSFWKVS